MAVFTFAAKFPLSPWLRKTLGMGPPHVAAVPSGLFSAIALPSECCQSATCWLVASVLNVQGGKS